MVVFVFSSNYTGLKITTEEIRKNKPDGATGYYEKDEGRVRYIRKTPKHYFYQTHTNGK